MNYTIREEIIHSITHGVGAALSIAGLTVLVVLAGLFGDVWRVVSFSIYGATLVILYLVSTLYHGFTNRKVKEFFRTMDLSAIHLLIAGTYTPFGLVSVRGPWGWSVLGVIWGLAIGGIIFTIVTRQRYEMTSLAIYLTMGWVGVIPIQKLYAVVPFAGIVLLVLGGLLYTVGVVFFLWERLPYNHAIWHLFVLGGSITHYFCILFYVLPMGPV